MSCKIPWKWGWWLGVPRFQETTLFFGHMEGKSRENLRKYMGLYFIWFLSVQIASSPKFPWFIRLAEFPYFNCHKWWYTNHFQTKPFPNIIWFAGTTAATIPGSAIPSSPKTMAFPIKKRPTQRLNWGCPKNFSPFSDCCLPTSNFDWERGEYRKLYFMNDAGKKHWFRACEWYSTYVCIWWIVFASWFFNGAKKKNTGVSPKSVKLKSSGLWWFITFPTRIVILRYPTTLAIVDLNKNKPWWKYIWLYMGQNWIPSYEHGRLYGLYVVPRIENLDQ